MKNIIIIIILLLANQISAQKNEKYQELKEKIKSEILKELKEEKKVKKNPFTRFELKGYGVINYYNYKWDTDTEKRNAVDAERLNFYLNYKFNNKIKLKTEIEIEHGGTGVTKELDKLEEFGEFETEVEAGGEVKLEQVYIDIAYKKYLNFKLGKFKVYFGLAQNLDTPDEYFTTHRPEMENELLPLGWYETGIEVNGKILNDKLQYKLALINGLDATGFSSRGFIRNGHQTRFEMANANNWAIATRLDYKLGSHKNSFIGFSTYFGNSADNRPKPDLKTLAYVFLAEGHISYNQGPLRFNSIFLYGNLQNSDLVTLRNKNLSNALGVKRTPVAKNAIGFSAEIGYNILAINNSENKQKLYPFARYDFYDSMHKTHASITDNPRWERSSITSGINWFIHKGVILKAQYSTRILGSKKLDSNGVLTNNNEKENTFSAGVGFVF